MWGFTTFINLTGLESPRGDTWGHVYDTITENLWRGLTEGRCTLNVSGTILWTEAKAG